MESSQTKTVISVIIMLAVCLVLGLALMRFNQAASDPDPELTPVQQLEALEKAGSKGSRDMQNFIQREKERLGDTRQAEQDVTE